EGGEVVGLEPPEHRAGAKAARHASRSLAQDAVAEVPAEGRIDLLHAVEVDQQERERHATPFDIAHGAHQPRLEERPVRQPCERVEARSVRTLNHRFRIYETDSVHCCGPLVLLSSADGAWR